MYGIAQRNNGRHRTEQDIKFKFNKKRDSKCCYRYFGCPVDSCCMYSLTISICSIIWVIIAIVLLVLSINRIEQNTFAIAYCKEQRTVSDVNEDGLYTFCPDVTLFQYDRKFIDNDMNINCYTKDGVIIELTLTTQYQLLKDELLDVFYEWGKQERIDDYIDIIIKDAIWNVCPVYNAIEFYNQRGQIEQHMITNITNVVDAANAHVKTGAVQLTNIKLPDKLMNQIHAKQIALEQVDIERNKRDQIIIDAETNKFKA